MKLKSKMKTAMAVAAVAAVGAFAPAMASANTWSSGGTSFAGPAHIGGSLTMTLPNAIKVTCSTVVKGNLDNVGGVAQGQVQSYLFGWAAGGACTTPWPYCVPSITVYTGPPRPITTSGTNVTFSGILYIVTFSGSNCGLAGSQLNVTGSMTGSVPSGTNQVVFTNSPGLTSFAGPVSAGPVTVSGTLRAHATNAAGNPDLARPITLQP
jgi:hypothetical protein